MQIIGLHKNVYKLYAWARTQECLDAYRINYEDSVRHWEALRKEGVAITKCAEFVGISRATYYRHKRVLKDLAQGVIPQSKAPKRRNKSRWGEAEMQLVLEVRRDSGKRQRNPLVDGLYPVKVSVFGAYKRPTLHRF